MSLTQNLIRKLDLAFSEGWGDRDPLRYEICKLSENKKSSFISGTLRFYAKTRSGEEKPAFENAFGPLRNENDVDACLADTLSQLLECHMSWPR